MTKPVSPRTSVRLFVAAALLLAPLAGRSPAAPAFTDGTASYGLSRPDGMSYAGGFVDLDGDGTHDLYVGNHWLGPASLYESDGGTGYLDVSGLYGVGNSDRHDALWGDFDNDGSPDQYIVHGAGAAGQENELFWNLGDGTFVEGAAAAGVEDVDGRGREATLADFDNDGYLDIFIVNDVRDGVFHPNVLYWNDGDGTFTRADNNPAIYETRLHCAGADYDLDGDVDIVVSNPQATDGEFYRNDGGGTFTDVTAATFPGITLPLKQANGLSWADYDNDGDLDLFAVGGNRGLWDYADLEGDSLRYYVKADAGESHYLLFTTAADSVTLFGEKADFQPLQCFWGGGGDSTTTYPQTFSVSDIAGTPPTLFTRNECLFLWSVSGAPEDTVYLVVEGKATSQFRAGGHIRPKGGTVTHWEQIGYDPPPPLASANWSNRLYRNEGNGTFAEVTSTAFDVTDSTTLSWGAAWADYDNDGWLDVYVSNGGTVESSNPANWLFRNDGDGTFTEVGASEGVTGAGRGMTDGAAWGDADGDGFLDLFLNNGAEDPPFGIGPRELMMNTPNGNHWAEFRLRGVASNGVGIGARMRFVTSAGTQWRWRLGESDNGYSNVDLLHVGLGSDTVIDTVQVFWPSGTTDTHLNVGTDKRYFVVEGAPMRTFAAPDLVITTPAVVDTLPEFNSRDYVMNLNNPGGAAATYSIVLEDCAGGPVPWLSVDAPSGGVWPGPARSLRVSVDGSLAVGAYCARVIVQTANGASGPDTLGLALEVVPAVTGVDLTSGRPLAFELTRPQPNPSRRGARLDLALPEMRRVEVAVFDVRGRRVARLLGGLLPPGWHSVEWNGRDAGGRRVTSGVYLVRATWQDGSAVRKLVVLD